jgi:hypothetical protein
MVVSRVITTTTTSSPTALEFITVIFVALLIVVAIGILVAGFLNWLERLINGPQSQNCKDVLDILKNPGDHQWSYKDGELYRKVSNCEIWIDPFFGNVYVSTTSRADRVMMFLSDLDRRAVLYSAQKTRDKVQAEQFRQSETLVKTVLQVSKECKYD